VIKDIHEQQLRDLAGPAASAEPRIAPKQLTLWRRGLGRGSSRITVDLRPGSRYRSSVCD
jgi:hypothetical protein